MQTRLHIVLALAAAVGLSTACQYLSPQRSGEGASGGEEGSLSNTPQRVNSRSASKNGRSRAAAPAAPAAPARPRTVVVPEGTQLPMELRTTISSGSSHAGDVVIARLTEDVRIGERVVLPERSEVRGRVTAAVGSGRVKGRARLAVEFEAIELDERWHDLEATHIDITAGTTRKRDAALIGGGALVGAVVDGKKGAGIGALLGGGAVLATKGKEVTLPAGTPVTLKLKRDLRID